MKPDDVSQEAWEMAISVIVAKDVYLNVKVANAVTTRIARAITAAVAAEREACAEAVRNCEVVVYGFHHTPARGDYIDAILARSTP